MRFGHYLVHDQLIHDNVGLAGLGLGAGGQEGGPGTGAPQDIVHDAPGGGLRVVSGGHGDVKELGDEQGCHGQNVFAPKKK